THVVSYRFFFQAEDGIRDPLVTGVQTCALPIFVVAAGRKQGVKPLSAVVSPEGLVGIVSTVDAQTSVVVSWAHPEFRASAMAADGSIYGIVAPHGTEGPRTWLLELLGVAS